MKIAIGGATDEGNRGYQEDRFKLYTDFNRVLRKEREDIKREALKNGTACTFCNIDFSIPRCFGAVYDGTGGNLCVRYSRDRIHGALARQILTLPRGKDGAEYLEHFKQAFANVQKRWRKKAYNEGNIADPNLSACTATVMLFAGSKVYIGYVGNSLAYLVPSGKSSSHPMIQLTVPHYPSNPTEQKRIEEAGGEVSSFRATIRDTQGGCCGNNKLKEMGRLGNGGLALSRALGGLSNSVVALGGVEGTLISVPEYREIELDERNQKGNNLTYSAVVICTDGWSDTIQSRLLNTKNQINDLFREQTGMASMSKHSAKVGCESQEAQLSQAAQYAADEILVYATGMQTMTRRCDNSTLIVAYLVDAFPKAMRHVVA